MLTYKKYFTHALSTFTVICIVVLRFSSLNSLKLTTKDLIRQLFYYTCNPIQNDKRGNEILFDNRRYLEVLFDEEW